MVPGITALVKHSILEWIDEKIIRRLKTWVLWGLVILFGTDLIVPDILPFVDELALGFLAWRSVAEIRRRRQPTIEADTPKAAIEASPEA